MKFKSFVGSLFFLIFLLVLSKSVNAEVGSLSNLNFTSKQTIMDPVKPVLYSIDAESKMVYSINFETNDISSIQLNLIPERLYFSNDELYVVLLKSGHQYYSDDPAEGAIAIINTDSFTLADQFNIDIDPFDIVVDDKGNIYITSGSNQWTSMKSYSRQTKQVISRTGIRMQSYAQISPTMNKIYTINTDVSPRDIEMFTIANGEFSGPNYDSPYHGDYDMSMKMKISPDGKYLFNGSGTIFKCSETKDYDITYVNKLDSSFSDITFDLKNNKFYTLYNGNMVKAYEYSTLKLLGVYDDIGEITSLFNYSNEIIAVCKSTDNMDSIKSLNKDDLKLCPQKGTITVDNTTNTGNYALTINVPENSNTTEYKLYEGAHILDSGTITNIGFSKTIKVNKKTPGLYNYILETKNGQLTAVTLQLTITVLKIDPKPYSPSLLSFTPKQIIKDTTKPIEYLIGEGSNSVYSINMETKQVTSIEFGLQPERLYFSNNELYVALLKSGHQYYGNDEEEEGSIAIINTDSFTITDQFDIDIDPFDIVVDDKGNIYITSGSNQWTSMKSYSRQTKQEISWAPIRMQSYAQISPTMNKIYTINTDLSPRDIEMFTIANGEFSGPNYESPYHGDYDMSMKMKISPDGKYLFNGAGTIFSCDKDQSKDIKYYTNLNNEFSDIVFDLENNMFYIAVSGGEIIAYDYATFKPIEKYTAMGEVSDLMLQNNKLIAICKTADDKYYVQAIELVNNATLSSINVDGKAIDNFDKNITSYSVIIQYSTKMPVVTATATARNSTVKISQIKALDKTAKITVIAADKKTTKAYTITFIVLPNEDATLNKLIINGETINDFNKDAENYDAILPSGTTKVPVVVAIATDCRSKGGAKISIIQAKTLDGTTAILVTAADGKTTKTYTVNFKVSDSNDATLKGIIVGGKIVEDFKEDTLFYSIKIPYGTKIPTVGAIKTDAKAKAVITQAKALDKTSIITVTSAGKKTSKIYTVAFTVLPNTDASLNKLTIDGKLINGFKTSADEYTVTLKYGVTIAPIVAGRVTDNRNEGATLEVTQATLVDGIGTATLKVTAADGNTTRSYTVKFITAPNTDATLSSIKVNDNIISKFEAKTTSYTVKIPAETTEVYLEWTTTDSDATVISKLDPAKNTVRIIVTAADGKTKKTYTIKFVFERPTSEFQLLDKVYMNGSENIKLKVVVN